MARWAPERRDTMRALADELLQHYSRGRVVVGVDGTSGADAGAFADDLATELRRAGHEVFRASMEDFQRPRAVRDARGADSAEGLYRDGYDDAGFRRVLLGPFRLAGSTGFSTALFDRERDVPFESAWETGPADAILVVDGPYLLRPELRGIWNFSVWLEAPGRAAAEPGAASSTSETRSPRELGAKQLYLRDAAPRTAASAIVDASDVDHPRRVFADSC